jgi:choline dehydrogenase-like flavoprotein
MNADFDAIIIGSGPAGVSTAFPLVEAGLRVLMVDGGRKATISPPSKPYLVWRNEEANQWKWMIGENFHALRNVDAASPKLRVPVHAPMFDGFANENRINSNGFVAIGSLAEGGLSNAWGCGVARFSSSDLRDFPFARSDIERSYDEVARRIGICGGVQDDLSAYFGLDSMSDPPIQKDALHTYILDKYEANRKYISASGVSLGHSRLAVLSRDREGRKACDISGNCLWGCHHGSLYSSITDIALLTKYSNFSYRSGFIVDRLSLSNGCRAVAGRDESGHHILNARKVILAAGTLATTRLVLQAINLFSPVAMKACPTAAFMLWIPKALGTRLAPAFGFGQLSLVLDLPNGISGYGALFNISGIPVAEFSKYMPLRKRYGIDILKALLSSCVVGNLFLPGHLTAAKVILDSDGSLNVSGAYDDSVSQLMIDAKRKIRSAFWKAGALLLPNSFTIARPGSDIHYASSIPMRTSPTSGESDPFGEVIGLNDVHVVDGACLPSLPSKPHTLTIMANADRIGRQLRKTLTTG